MWVDKQKPLGQENILISAQFLYVLSETISIIVDIKKEKRTPMMQEALRSFIPLLLEHYERWVLNSPGPFQVRAWGCRYNGQDVPTGLNHSELLNMKMDKKLGDRKSPAHCNMVTDTDMWIIAGVINILAAHKKEKESVPITYEEYNNMLAYAKTGVNLLESRFSYTNLENFEGNKIIGAVFDVGIGDDRPGHAFAGYSGREFPKTVRADKSKFHKKGVGWDLSHARRFVHVFETIIKSTDILGLKISSKELAEKMANQLIYATFNRDFKKPLFTNYMDGTNGWYRVDYSGKAGFAYGPWDMSIAVMTGGYGFWSKYNVDVERVFVAFFRMLESTDSDVRQHVIDHYETSHWSQYRRKSGNDFKNLDDQKTQSLLIQFLPSICLIIR
jgi:hypothetical protein